MPRLSHDWMTHPWFIRSVTEVPLTWLVSALPHLALLRSPAREGPGVKKEDPTSSPTMATVRL